MCSCRRKVAPRIGPGSELTLLVKLGSQITTLTRITVNKGKNAIKQIDIQGGTAGRLAVNPNTGELGSPFNDLDISTGEFQLVLYFSTRLEDLREIKDDGVELVLTVNENNSVITISQPVIVEGLTPQQPVISRKDSVPTEYTRNIERFDVIQKTAEALKFENYARAIDDLLCKGTADEGYRSKANTRCEGEPCPSPETMPTEC